MDERKPQSEEIEDWMKQLLPDGAADIGMWQHPERTSVKVERPNTCQLFVDSHQYQRNLSQHQLMQVSFGVPRQQTSGGCNSASLMAKREQESLNVLQFTEQTTLQKLLETKGGVALERAHPRMQMPTLHQSQNLTLADQLKPGHQTQGMLLAPLQGMPEAAASPESTSQMDLTNSIDWVNTMYQKILQVKEMYLSQFVFLYHKMPEMKRQATDAEIANRWEKSRVFIEKIIRLLNISKSELVHLKRERVYQLMNDAMKYISQTRPRNSLYAKQTHQVEASINHIEAAQIQQRENHLQFNSAPASLHQPLRAGPGGALSLPQSSFNVGSTAGVHKVDGSLTVNSYQYNNLMRPTQQWSPQGSVAPSHRKGGSQIGFDPRALRMLLHPSGGVSQYNNLGGTSQQTITSSRNIFNSLEYSVSPMAQQMPVSMPPLQNNQQDQAMKRQKMKQPVQQQQQQLMTDKNKQQILQKRNEDTKLRRFVGINQKWSPVIPPSSSPYTNISPQNSQQSSSQIELKDLSSKFPKSATPSLSSASPSALPSPLTPMTPLTPSSMPADNVKSPLLDESGKLAKNPAVASQDTNRNQLATDTQRSTKSCLHRESIPSGDKQLSQAKGDPLKRLVEVVKSVSSKALHATLRDINAVANLTDRADGNFLRGKPTRVNFHDLADDIIINSDQGMKSRVKRELDTVAMDDFTASTEFCSSASIKRLKTESNNLLLEEIKEINKTLIEVVVDVINLEDVSRPGSDEGTLIRCSYIPLGFSGNVKIPDTSKLMFPNLLLELIVSADYPNSSPIVLEKVPSGLCDAEEGKYLWIKAKSNFILSLRKFTQPMSVKDMAQAWDVSAREVFNELARQMGGGSFSSTYGNWETCAVAV
ncbi:hypothetical protein C2S52_010798 [Perilla frutescens var. hirtella]|nr:hypothetical protein C2S52_010798 [Perilla frutescens var. hirtella]KAH6817613.1 hypothetical protein C2S51_001216 [Perilla frutescens var. frutescens]